MSDTTTIPAVVETYFAMWNESDPAARAALVRETWDETGRHVDPLADVAGYPDLDGYVGGVQAQFPGHAFERTTGVDAHHDQLRWGWRLVGPDGAVVVEAIDVAELAEDGRLRRVAAFFGGLPAD